MTEAQQTGLIHALVLDGAGGARVVAFSDLQGLSLQPEETLWLHWDRGHESTQVWLRERSGLSVFPCDLLLEENTRPRLVPLADDALLLFLRGVNLDPDAQPEDMVSMRIHVEAKRIISLRLRPMRATETVVELLAQGRGPRTSSEVMLYLADSLTDRVDHLVASLADQLDGEEDRLDENARYTPNHDAMLAIRRTAASLRRFLLPQREIYGQLTRQKLAWFVDDDTDYWNELSNRLVRFLEELDLVRERVSLVLEAEQRRRSDHMNRTLYVLGIITGFFLPMTFVTGLLGMNVGGIPGSENPFGFAVACIIMVCIVASQWWIFRRLRWL